MSTQENGKPQKAPAKPKGLKIELDAEGKWTQVFDGRTYRFREETMGERSTARNEALATGLQDPQYEEQARMFAAIIERQKPDGSWENLTSGEVMARGPIFFGWAAAVYAGGLGEKAKKLIPSDNASETTSQTTKSEQQVRP